MHSAKIRCVGLGNVFIGHFVTPPPMEKTKLRVAVLPMNFTSIIGPNVFSETGFHWIPKVKVSYRARPLSCAKTNRGSWWVWWQILAEPTLNRLTLVKRTAVARH